MAKTVEIRIRICVPRWRVSVAYAALAPVCLIRAQIPDAWLDALTRALAGWVIACTLLPGRDGDTRHTNCRSHA
ncbi:hypothetical protein [Rhodovulum sp. BSW8]|uniref:hypothetical protein n=1 Tax=Rhodovulum sp. BSW8 TaxID=2259645 RepID=UPI001058A423|nr:hypothetical protein [Rhodovulum sp. BSW8]